MQYVTRSGESVKFVVQSEVIQKADDFWTSMEDHDKKQIQQVQSKECSRYAKLLLFCFAALKVEYKQFEDAFTETLKKFYAQVPDITDLNENYKSYRDYREGNFRQHCRQIYSYLYASNKANPALMLHLQDAEHEVDASARTLALLQGALLMADKANPLFRQSMFLFHSYRSLYPSLFNDGSLLKTAVLPKVIFAAGGHQSADPSIASASTIVAEVLDWKQSEDGLNMVHSPNDRPLKVRICKLKLSENSSYQR